MTDWPTETPGQTGSFGSFTSRKFGATEILELRWKWNLIKKKHEICALWRPKNYVSFFLIRGWKNIFWKTCEWYHLSSDSHLFSLLGKICLKCFFPYFGTFCLLIFRTLYWLCKWIVIGSSLFFMVKCLKSWFLILYFKHWKSLPLSQWHHNYTVSNRCMWLQHL